MDQRPIKALLQQIGSGATMLAICRDNCNPCRNLRTKIIENAELGSSVRNSLLRHVWLFHLSKDLNLKHVHVYKNQQRQELDIAPYIDLVDAVRDTIRTVPHIWYKLPTDSHRWRHVPDGFSQLKCMIDNNEFGCHETESKKRSSKPNLKRKSWFKARRNRSKRLRSKPMKSTKPKMRRTLMRALSAMTSRRRATQKSEK